jgi:hypothetical protein
MTGTFLNDLQVERERLEETIEMLENGQMRHSTADQTSGELTHRKSQLAQLLLLIETYESQP